MNSTVEQLIQKQREATQPEGAVTDFDALLARAAQALQARWEGLEVELGGETVEVAVGKAGGAAWLQLVAEHPPTSPADVDLGYNADTLPSDYPIDRLQLAGEPTTRDTWRAVYSLLEVEDRKDVQAVMWWLNIGEPRQRRGEIGL